MPSNPSVPETLSSRKITLNRVSLSDSESLHEVFSNPKVMQFWNLSIAQNAADTLAWIERSLGMPTAYHAAWSITDNETGRMIGVVSYYDREPCQDRTKINYALLPNYHNKEILNVVISHIIDVCFDTLKSNRVEYLADTNDNISKCSLVEAGFKFEGVLRGRFRSGKTYRDVESYSLLGEDWSALNNKPLSDRDSSVFSWRLPKGDPGTKLKEWEIQCFSDVDDSDEQTPLGLAFPVSLSGNKLDVFKADRPLVIKAPHKVLKSIIETSCGVYTIKEIAANVPKSFNSEDVSALLSALVLQGILIPSDRRIEQQLVWAQNPPLYHKNVQADLPMALAKKASERVDSIPKNCTILRAPGNVVLSLLQERKSTRTFAGTSLKDSELAALLYGAYGVLNNKKCWKNVSLARRTVPSGGGIYPLALTWAQWRETESLKEGIYRVHFGPNNEIGFELISKNFQQVFRSVINPVQIIDAHGALIVSANYGLSRSKYGNKAVPLSLLEAGHVSQNVALIASSLGIGNLELGAFLDKETKEISGNLNCEPVVTIVIGNIDPDDNENKQNNRAPIDFSWLDNNGSYQPPFHIARSRIVEGKRITDWCWGRSPDPLMAIKKCVGESIERLACQSPQKVKWALPTEIGEYIDPERFVSYPISRYKKDGFALSPFQKDKVYPWVQAKRVVDGKLFSVLTDQVYFNNSIDKKYTYPYTSITTSGVAAFPTLEGAIERALLELIERHMFMLVWMKRILCPHVAIHTLPADHQKHISDLNAHGWDVSVLLMSKEPVVSFLIFVQNAVLGMTRVSASSGFNPEDALMHALQEVESSIPTAPEGSVFTPRRIEPRMLKSPQDHGDLYLQRKYFRKADWLLKNASILSFDEVASACKSAAEVFDYYSKKNMPSYVVDMTPAVNTSLKLMDNVKVARVLIEGLIPIFFGYRMEPKIPSLTHDVGNDTVYGQAEDSRGAEFPHPFY